MGGGIVGGGGGRVEVIAGKGCSRLFQDFSSSFRGISSFSLEPLSPASSASTVSESKVKIVKSNGPFAGVVVCVTGLSKETRKQVKEATERLGGQYSPHLHPRCTHLVYSFHGHKFEHALKHGQTIGLFLVTISWFVDSVRRNVRLDEMLYAVNKIGDNGLTPNDGLKRVEQNSGAENSCLPAGLHKHNNQPNMIGMQFPERESKRQTVSSFIFGQSFYIDSDVSAELQSKVAEAVSGEGASIVERWFVGCNATHVVCEGPSVQKYLGHSSNIVTPLWVLKSAKEKSLQRLVHLSADLARYTGAMLDNLQHGVSKDEVNGVISSGDVLSSVIKVSHGERQTRVNLAKDGVRKRRNRRMQTCHTPIRPITPGSLLDSICWSISDPISTASIYTESSSVENATEDRTSMFFDGKESETSFVNLSRPLTESEKSELIFKGNFLTIMFPVDRFSEMGPCSRTFFSNKGFTCLQVLDYIYAFYQENMSAEEIEIAIHTDSRHADRLRSAYSRKGSAEIGRVEFKRIDFLGSRKSFEMLKRVSGDNNSNLYELLIRA
ncbi:DNA topoisomerase 2-binding protein 1 [Phtheirospermum japonicum]|uniref:DNA topoisomerase 2-binding protein 1 n=1 Tax=Phtheirospermum japonicum TaxID=374723 RepID=A0A830C2E3_9LAMI|nr:DNA topoisomerase 2-binding protein 1 [Phtheirospermum japonicum]